MRQTGALSLVVGARGGSQAPLLQLPLWRDKCPCAEAARGNDPALNLAAVTMELSP